MISLKIFQPTLVWEGPYVDAQSIPHLIAGFLAAYLLTHFKISRWRGFLIVVILGILWELTEEFILHIRVTETNTNSAMDVVCNAVGYLVGFQVAASRLSRHDKFAIAIAAAAIFVGIYILHYVLGA